MVRHRVTLAVEDAEKRGEKGKEVRHQAALFYADEGMVASSDPRWLQRAFNALVGLFERVGLRTNVGKTVSMACTLCSAAGNQSEEAYGQNMTGEEPTYWERQKDQVECEDCGKEMGTGSLASHLMTQNGKAKAQKWSWNDSATGRGETRTYRIEFSTKGGTRGCTVDGCLGKPGTWTAIRMHFCCRNVRDIVIVLEEGNLPHPRCSRCYILVPWRTLNGKHHGTAMGRSGLEQKKRRLAETELW